MKKIKEWLVFVCSYFGGYMKNEEILKLIYLITDLCNCVLPVTKMVEETSPKETVKELYDYLFSILEKEIGDPILADKLLDYACFMSNEELLKEIEDTKSLL